MAVLAGIDEAGFGPILGPLVVSSTAFSLPQNLLKADLWQILRKSIANRRAHLAGRLLVADSKKAYHRKEGIKHLQRTVLAFLACFGEKPATLAGLLALLCPDCLERLNDYPWHKNPEKYRIAADWADIAIASNVLKNDLAASGAKLLEIRSYCLDVAYYNKMVRSVNNKANVLFTAVSKLISNAFRNFGDDDLQIIIDRQGGRVRYRTALQRMFPEADLAILEETDCHSSYQLQQGGRKMRLHFAVGADDRFLPVSLASMVCKYIRELMIDSMNQYFIGFCSGLKPTAGYWKDGLRFIEDLKTHIPHLQFDSNLLCRCR
jgi:ribonuclease HII